MNQKEKALFDYTTGSSLQEVLLVYPEFDPSLLDNYQPTTKGIITKDDNMSITLYVLGYQAKSVQIPLIENLNSKVFWDLHNSIVNNTELSAKYIRGLFLTTNTKSKVSNFIGNSGITITGSEIYYKGIKQDGQLVDHILKAIKNKKRVRYLVNFLDKLMSNPSYHIHTRLYDFLQHNDIEIQEDGDFIAFKNVNENFTDIYTGTFDNSVGSVVKMERNLVDDNDRNTCSAGLHVAAKHYLPNFSSTNGKTIAVKVNPMNILSIPLDYGNSKMRTCEYLVLKEVNKNGEEK